MPGRNHSREFKLECCWQIATGQKRPAQICREHNLAESLLSRWRKEYEARGEEAFREKQTSETAALEPGSPSWSGSAANWPWRTRF
ncbi:MAG: transposase [Chloroflexota bacterium]|nr:transposase [Chloroflexota bacterium]